MYHVRLWTVLMLQIRHIENMYSCGIGILAMTEQ